MWKVWKSSHVEKNLCTNGWLDFLRLRQMNMESGKMLVEKDFLDFSGRRLLWKGNRKLSLLAHFWMNICIECRNR